ncbi:flagellin [Caulobacter sp. CCNWLY153]|jgi:flagellin|uniref:Flagellin n=1 Tax=Caulobacter radicis TaxID=2172650 RepID=A0A2T9K0B4_9CAUL|nr:flagellin [Caulobacter radicis]PVM71462.1 flagellin [Caulobacter radicis]PVM89399.1 flagellin [Caulobacter radicis]
MPQNSINTNVGAMIALQSLNTINRDLATTLRRIATGLKISSPKDNPAVWATAKMQASEAKSLDAVRASLQRGQSTVDVALAAGDTVTDLLDQMKQKMLAASDPSLTTASRKLLNDDYVSLRKQIDRAVENASFNGVNLISAGNTGNIRALANAKADQTIDVDHVDLSTGGAALAGMRADLLTAPSSTDIKAMDTAMQNVTSALSRLGTQANGLDTHLTFIDKLQDTLEASVGRLIDADMAQEATRLQALQIKQQLAIKSLSIANAAPSYILKLFGG